MAKTIVVDAGHGGYDNGASYEDRLEKNDALRLALAVGDILQKDGYNVVYTRTTDVYQQPAEKARIANENGADFFVSIHRNASPTPNMYSGVQTLIFDDSGIKAQVARNINEEVSKLGFSNLGISIRPNLAVLKRTKMPAVLVEAGFINTDFDNQLFDEKFNKLAQAIANGIEKTLQEDTVAYSYEENYRVQTGLYRQCENARAQQQKLNEDGFESIVVPSGIYFAVQAGNYNSLEKAAKAATKLRCLGYETLVVTSIR